MMKDAWDDYQRYAWGDNELRPVSQTGHTGVIFGDAKIGATIVDSLDTLYIMEMMDELADARRYVENELDFSQVVSNSCFSFLITQVLVVYYALFVSCRMRQSPFLKPIFVSLVDYSLPMC